MELSLLNYEPRLQFVKRHLRSNQIPLHVCNKLKFLHMYKYKCTFQYQLILLLELWKLYISHTSFTHKWNYWTFNVNNYKNSLLRRQSGVTNKLICLSTTADVLLCTLSSCCCCCVLSYWRLVSNLTIVAKILYGTC